MAEAISPQLKQRGLFSPSSPFFIGSNDDNFERAQARAARAASIRSMSVAPGCPPLFSTDDSCLDKQQILELFQNCIKLASENKINQKNTWELNLIDHLCNVIKVEEENDAETNFQKASCTLEAGVKIYSMRVDSVLSEAYKVLGGINRVGHQEEEQDITSEHATDVNKREERCSKRDDKKLSPLSTLKSSFESLNVKKFEAAFLVDPLYHQTSAQFDEGGAKGLLLNNLGVYGNCQVLFDSLEVPGKCTSSSDVNDIQETIDLSFAKECIEQMVLQMPKMDEISPSLRQIVSQFDDNNRRSYEGSFNSGENSYTEVDEKCEDNYEACGDVFANNETWDLDHDDQVSVVHDGINGGDSTLPNQQKELDSSNFSQYDSDHKFDEVDEYLLLSLGLPSKRNAWAGPDHWKYKKSKDSVNVDKENEPALKEKRPKRRKAEIDIDFTKAFEMDMTSIFSAPKNPKSIMLPVNKVSCNTKLPEDCHYQPESLEKLFLLPNVTCLGRRQQKVSDEFNQKQDHEGSNPIENEFGGAFNDVNGVDDAYGNNDESINLVSQPRQVNKIEVQYDKTSKLVDVQVLKETLWDYIQKTYAASSLQKESEDNLSFKQILSTFPTDCKAAGFIEDISPHLCFICLLHLANEHGLRITGHENMDDLSIYL